METIVGLDERGYLPDRYAKHADRRYIYAGTPTCSFPFEVTGIPEGTNALALTIVDFDSIPVCGFPWIHWCAYLGSDNVRDGVLSIPEDASNQRWNGMVQGRNSSASRLVRSNDPLLASRYNGPQPPDRDHDYTFTVYALDALPQLADGYWMNELLHAIHGHVLAQVSVDLPARS